MDFRNREVKRKAWALLTSSEASGSVWRTSGTKGGGIWNLELSLLQVLISHQDFAQNQEKFMRFEARDIWEWAGASLWWSREGDQAGTEWFPSRDLACSYIPRIQKPQALPTLPTLCSKGHLSLVHLHMEHQMKPKVCDCFLVSWRDFCQQVPPPSQPGSFGTGPCPWMGCSGAAILLGTCSISFFFRLNV